MTFLRFLDLGARHSFHIAGFVVILVTMVDWNDCRFRLGMRISGYPEREASSEKISARWRKVMSRHTYDIHHRSSDLESGDGGVDS